MCKRNESMKRPSPSLKAAGWPLSPLRRTPASSSSIRLTRAAGKAPRKTLDKFMTKTCSFLIPSQIQTILPSKYKKEKCRFSRISPYPPVDTISAKIGVTGFEPATSWSQTRRSSQAEPHPADRTDYSKFPWKCQEFHGNCLSAPISFNSAVRFSKLPHSRLTPNR